MNIGSDEEKAKAWALSMGYVVPSKMNGCLMGIFIAIGLLAYVVPGVLLLVWLFVNDNQYKRDMKSLLEKWIDAGRPQPGEGIKEVTKFERVVEKVENIGTELRLEGLNSMKEKGLINEEEYQAMINKVLCL